MKTIKIGSVYKLPQSEAHIVVIYKYKVHKELVLCALFDYPIVHWEPQKVKALIHSFFQPMDEGLWEQINTISIPEVEYLTTRSNACELYVGNEKIGPMPSQHFRQIPSLTTPYFSAFERISNEILSGSPSTKAALKYLRETDELISKRAYNLAMKIKSKQ